VLPLLPLLPLLLLLLLLLLEATVGVHVPRAKGEAAVEEDGDGDPPAPRAPARRLGCGDKKLLSVGLPLGRDRPLAWGRREEGGRRRRDDDDEEEEVMVMVWRRRWWRRW
jgi:hypothetical protein